MVDECPKFLARNATDKTHAIVIEDGKSQECIIPLSLRGVTSYFPTRKPSQQEYEDHTDRTFVTVAFNQKAKGFIE